MNFLPSQSSCSFSQKSEESAGRFEDERDLSFQRDFLENISEEDLQREKKKILERRKALELWESVCVYEQEITHYFASIYEEEHRKTKEIEIRFSPSNQVGLKQ
jgi:hypothetical protein